MITVYNDDYNYLLEMLRKETCVTSNFSFLNGGGHFDVGTLDTMFNCHFKTVHTISTCHAGGAFEDAKFMEFIATQLGSERFDEFSKTNESEIRKLLQIFRVHKAFLTGQMHFLLNASLIYMAF